MVTVRLYRPVPGRGAPARRCRRRARRIAVLDRTKEPGAVGEPLYLDVRAAIDEAMDDDEPPFAMRAPRHRRPLRPVVQGVHPGDGRRPCSTSWPRPAPPRVHRRHRRRRHPPQPRPVDTDVRPLAPARCRRVFFGLGSDGTVGANKSSVKIIGEGTDLFAQGYFVYDSKKSGSVTVSHLRFGPEPIRSTYLIERRRLRGLPPVRPAREDEGARARPARRHVPAQQPVRRPTRSGTTCPSRSRSRSSTSGSTSG